MANRMFRLIKKAFAYWRKNGIRATLKKTWLRQSSKHKGKRLIKKQYSENDLKQQRTATFEKNITFSIVVPLYNTPEKFLREMIESVQAQTYAKWELCMADGSDENHDYVGKICREYTQNDGRIKYRKLEKNLGISGNTNACIDMATEEYIGLLDHDDILHPAALFEVMRAICDKGADFIYTDEATFESPNINKIVFVHFKPDYAPDNLRSNNYICHFTTFRASLIQKAGKFCSEFDGSQDYDMILRLTEEAKAIVHIPKVLYYWRSHIGSVASDISAKPYAVTAAKKALAAHLERIGLEGVVEDAAVPSSYRIAYKINGTPLISILIPNKDHIDDLKKCISSIRDKTTYPNWEIVIIENNSEGEQTFAYYEQLRQIDERIRITCWNGEFNYPAINNYGAQQASGDYFILLNNDTEVITPDWIEQMLTFSQREDVGAVGAMLYYPNDTVQHAGVIIGIAGTVGRSHKGFPRDDIGYMGRLSLVQDLSAVTGACMMIRRNVWEEAGGLCTEFGVAFYDIDLCLRLRKAGYLIVWTPYAELYHYERKRRGKKTTAEKRKRVITETALFRTRWKNELEAGDPYYNPNFTLDREDFSLR